MATRKGAPVCALTRAMPLHRTLASIPNTYAFEGSDECIESNEGFTKDIAFRNREAVLIS